MDENLQQYLTGKGVDVSSEAVVDGAAHIVHPHDNLYSLHPEIAFESQDFVYSYKSVNQTKFPIILLTEWIKYLKVEGYMVVTFEENKHLNVKDVHRIFNQYLHRHTKLAEYTSRNVDGKKEHTFVFQKYRSNVIEGDSMDKWTFGMITVGKRNEWVRQFIQSVRDQKIPHYEIIVVGTWNDPDMLGDDIRYIHFTENDDKGWITKKKNLIFENAKYNNVFPLHDRFYLHPDWFENMKKFGNLWDGLVFPIIDKTGHEYVHWSVWGKGLQAIGYVDRRDWGENYFAGGTFMALKKSAWNHVKLDEGRFWAEQEDSDYGLRLAKQGYVTRVNNDSKLHTTVTYFNDAPVYEFNDQKLGRALEHRGKKWKIIQPVVDVMTRVGGVKFLRAKSKTIKFAKKILKKENVQSGGKRS